MHTICINYAQPVTCLLSALSFQTATVSTAAVTAEEPAGHLKSCPPLSLTLQSPNGTSEPVQGQLTGNIEHVNYHLLVHIVLSKNFTCL